MSSDEDISDFEGLNDPNEVADDVGSRDENAELSTRERPAYTSSEISSLYDLSLQSISHNLERYNLAFSTTEDIYFRRNLQFLQRRHSPYLISRQLVNGYLDESYWQFLINEYVTELNVGILANGNYDAAIARIAEVGHGFLKVLFDFPESAFDVVIDFVNKVVSKLPNVEILNFFAYCNNETLEAVSLSCPALNELYIDDSKITDAGLRALCQEKEEFKGNSLKLKILSVSDIYNIDDGITFLLQNMPTLEIVNYLDLPMILYRMHTDEMNNALQRKFNLTTLRPSDIYPQHINPSMTELLTVFTSICPHINELSVPIRSREDLELVSKFAELKNLSITEIFGNNGQDFSNFLNSHGKLLQKLKVRNVNLSVSNLVQNCPKLEVLDLQNVLFVSLDSGATMKPLNNLRELRLESFNFEEMRTSESSVTAILNCCPKLEKLVLMNCEFENCEELVTNLSKFCEGSELQYVQFCNCDVEEAFLQTILLTCLTLKTLVVEYCDNITSSTIDNLYEISRSLKNHVVIEWNDERTDFDSFDGNDDIFDDYYSEYDSDDMYLGYEGYDIDDFFYGDAYDSDNS